MTEEIIVSDSENGITAESLLRGRGISRRLLTRLKRTENGITRGGELCRSIDRVFSGDILRLRIPENGEGAEPNPLLNVSKVYEDEYIIVYNKPAGMPVHQSHGHYRDTLANAFAAEFPRLPFRGVNRLDRDTSGLCIAAKNSRSANIPASGISKIYYAVCEGIISGPLTVDAPIARERESVIKRVVREDGRRAVTEIIPLEGSGSHTLLKIKLHTGRTHQIRVHLAYIGHPLAGDRLYGGGTDKISRQALHCGELRFTHPVSGKILELFSELPGDIAGLMAE